MSKPKHILKSQQFDRQALDQLFSATDELAKQYNEFPEKKAKLRRTFEGKLLFAVFYEPSTRTRFSFCAAAHHLGIDTVQTENAKEFSSAIKGETLEDSIRAMCEYDPDIIVLRHNETGAADRAAAAIDRWDYRTSLINAGDGTGQHPTQALLDLYTIRSELHRLDDLKITIGGDLANGRTGRSLVYLLSKFSNIEFTFLSPDNLRMGKDIIDHLEERDIPFKETDDITSALEGADVAYWTRVQTERGGKNGTVNMTITPEQLNIMEPDSIILHPLPRVDEIDHAVDSDKRAAYFRQVRNGMLIRMQLLKELCEQWYI